jgi:spore germination protein YaaH
MKKFIILFLFTAIFLPQYLLSQKSIHQLEYEAHKSLKKEAPLPGVKDIKIIALQDSKKDMSYSVYGYLPDWEYQNAKYNLNYDLLTHISAFEFDVDASGNISAPSYWPWSDVINAAHVKGVKVIMTAVNFTAASIHTILTDGNVKQNFINKALAIMNAYQLDGINVDFEGITTADRGSILNNFMSNLSDAVHSASPGKEVSFAGPAVNWGGWDLLGLANSCDYIFIMGYDFYGSWSTTSGASAPLTPNNGTSISIRNTVEVQYADVTNTKPKKLILGVPYYGQKWKTVDSLPHSTSTGYVGSTRFSSDAIDSKTYGVLWATDTQTPYYTYNYGGIWTQVWFDNETSLGLKYQLAQDKGYKGVGMWALNYDGTRQELWNELRKRFYRAPNGVKNNPEQVSSFKLNQNYPNPFNPSTKISFTLRKTSYVSLKIYDMFGREVKELLNTEKPAGTYELLFDAKNLASSVYFCRLIAGEYFQTIKMSLMK